MRPKVGVVTLGQSPRPDMVGEMRVWLGDVEPVERGALDDLTPEQIAEVHASNGEDALLTRLRDGSSVVVGERAMVPRLQAAISRLEAQGADAVLLACTGPFPAFQHSRPLLLAERLLVEGAAAVARGCRVGVICPLPEQEEATRRKWSDLFSHLHVAVGSPYGPLDALRRAARRLREARVEFVILDCMGYTQAMKEVVRAEAGVPVLLARSLVARLAAEVVA
ncbi:AroM family protein [Limnochorda pilosa]|uniref:AroM family protein n=2 Tax=Limnochorda pilosa TaxID=1555112 RepID=A0A0K2SMD4_LIMPI|nr:AroM family protein [Limnochorda pilosa]